MRCHYREVSITNPSTAKTDSGNNEMKRKSYRSPTPFERLYNDLLQVIYYRLDYQSRAHFRSVNRKFSGIFRSDYYLNRLLHLRRRLVAVGDCAISYADHLDLENEDALRPSIEECLMKAIECHDEVVVEIIFEAFRGDDLFASIDPKVSCDAILLAAEKAYLPLAKVLAGYQPYYFFTNAHPSEAPIAFKKEHIEVGLFLLQNFAIDEEDVFVIFSELLADKMNSATIEKVLNHFPREHVDATSAHLFLLACNYDRPKIAQLLLDSGVVREPNQIWAEYIEIPLFNWGEDAHPEIAVRLGADVNLGLRSAYQLMDNWGTELAEYLTQIDGADPQFVLKKACEQGEFDVVRGRLMHIPFDPCEECEFISLAVEHGHEEIANFLAERMQ